MKIADGKFGAELITTKGRIYKFDDIHCMINIDVNLKKVEYNQKLF